MITYFEVLEDRSGFKSTSTCKIDPMAFAMMITLAADDSAKEMLSDLVDDVVYDESALNDDPFALYAALRDNEVSHVTSALGRNGFWAKMWEEGSHGFAFKGFEKACQNKLRDIEARIANDAWGW